MLFSARALCTQLYSGGTSELALPGVPPSPSARSLSRSSQRDLSASLSLRVSQSVSQSAGATRFARIAPYAKRARTHAREGSSSSDHLLSLCCLIDRGGGQPCVEITSYRGGGVGEDLLLRTAGDVRGDGVKSGISHASNGRHASSAFVGDKQSGRRCPLRYLSTCVLSFFFLLRLPRGKGSLSLLPPHTGVVRATPGGGTERHSSRTIIMRSAAAVLAAATALVLVLDGALARHKHRSGNGAQKSDISLWIDQQQTKIFSGLAMEIYAIAEGRVLSPLLDPEFESKLPIIPSEVSHVNFTWKAGTKKYYYNFFRLKSFDESILKTPSITIETHGRVPKRPKEFSILLPCAGKGIAQFGIGLMIESRNGIPLNGTPLRFRLRKECSVREPNPGPCPDGYLGPPHCNKALCYPKCMNGGNCTAPGVCSCPPGYQGPYCEGGICREKCLNGGKCVQKDVCECTKGYFGLHCEFSKCVIPCLNGGKCKGNNICRCPKGFKGNHCEIGRRSPQRSTCTRACRNGTCQPDNTCRCDSGWFGKLCNKNKPWA